MNTPQSFRAGDSVAWTESLPEYPASAGWVLTQRLLWVTGSPVDIPNTPNGDNFDISLNATATASWQVGTATLVTAVSKGTQRILIEQRKVQILPDLLTVTNLDDRSVNKIGLDNAKAALKAYVDGGKMHVAEYDIAGRKMKFRSAQEIRDLISYYETEVAKENAAAAILNGQSPGRVTVSF